MSYPPARRPQHPPTFLAHYAPGTDGESERREAELADLFGDTARANRLRRDAERLTRTYVRGQRSALDTAVDL